MSPKMNGLMLTLAGLGLLAGGVCGSSPSELHARVVARTQGGAGATPTDLRASLGGDPNFDNLLGWYRRRTLAGQAADQDAEDALDEALLRIWKRRPELLLLPPDEVVRYLRVALSRNLASIKRKDSSSKVRWDHDPLEIAEQAAAEIADAGDEASASDLLARIRDGLAKDDVRVLEARLEGRVSQRAVARQTGLSRHVVASADERIAQRIGSLLRDCA